MFGGGGDDDDDDVIEVDDDDGDLVSLQLATLEERLRGDARVA